MILSTSSIASSSVSSAPAGAEKGAVEVHVVGGRFPDAVLVLLVVAREGWREDREEEAGEHHEEHDAARRGEALARPKRTLFAVLNQRFRRRGSSASASASSAVSFSLACFHSEIEAGDVRPADVAERRAQQLAPVVARRHGLNAARPRCRAWRACGRACRRRSLRRPRGGRAACPRRPRGRRARFASTEHARRKPGRGGRSGTAGPSSPERRGRDRLRSVARGSRPPRSSSRVARAIDLAHAPRPDGSDDVVRAETGSGSDGHSFHRGYTNGSASFARGGVAISCPGGASPAPTTPC